MIEAESSDARSSRRRSRHIAMRSRSARASVRRSTGRGSSAPSAMRSICSAVSAMMIPPRSRVPSRLFRAALDERSRLPLQARVYAHIGLGWTLRRLGVRDASTDRLHEAVAAFGSALARSRGSACRSTLRWAQAIRASSSRSWPNDKAIPWRPKGR